MAGQAAAVAGTYGDGRVFATALHPESDAADHDVLRGAVRYVARRDDIGWELPQRRRGQLSVGVMCAGLILFVLFYHRIFAVTFDEAFAQATGVKAKAYNMLIAAVIAVVISLAMRLVGSLLISALIIFPAMSAMRIFRSFRAVTLCSGVLSVVCALLGILISIVSGTPVGSTIVAVNMAAFLLCCGAARIQGGKA